MATMQDVADLAGVSLSTVSFALNNTRPVSAATRRRIEAAMNQLHYQPNALARGLASRRSRIIALTLPATDSGLGDTAMGFVAAAAAAARSRGYHLVLWPFPFEQAEDVGELSRQGLADGVLVMEVLMADRRVQVLQRAQVPFVLIGRTADPESVPFVDIDFDQTAHTAVNHLAALGHREMAFVNHSEHSRQAGYGPTIRIAAGIQQAATDAGVLVHQVYCPENARAGKHALGELLDLDPHITAVIIMNDDAALGALAELDQRGIRVPEQMSVLSIVSSPAAAHKTIAAVTALHAPGAELGRMGVEALLDRLEERPGAGHIAELLGCTLEQGTTTGPAPRPRQPQPRATT